MRTASGRVITEELIEAMAREAEAGFEPSQIRSLYPGRPSRSDSTSFRVQFNVSPDTFEALLERARVEERGVGELARLALEQYLGETVRRTATDEAEPAAQATVARD
jgi:CRISPR-associated endonuclease/helicase Cas3